MSEPPAGPSVESGLPILNLKDATFECIFGRGCEGICCRQGRPLVYAEEIQRIDANLRTFLPMLRPEARARVEKAGYLTRRRKRGQPMARLVKGWCVFFHQGCVLHRAGAAEGDKFRYKPAACALFPLERDERDRWYVRQRGFKGERWDLFCLDPKASPVRAADSLREEIGLAQRFTDQATASPEAEPQECPGGPKTD